MKILIFVSLLSSTILADSLKLSTFHSGAKLDWRTPRALIWSMYKGQDAEKPVGHVHVELQCSDPTLPYFATGMTMSNGQAIIDDIKEKGHGFQTLFNTYDGRLDESSTPPENTKFCETGQLNYLDIKISPTTCQRLSAYYQDYKRQGVEKNYGFSLRPRYREGSSCSSLAVSFMEVGGILTEEFKTAWSHQVLVPLNLLGGPGTGKHINPYWILFSPVPHPWAKPSKPHVPFHFYNPDQIHEWIGNHPLARRTDRECHTVELDMSQTPTPTEEFWLKD